MVLVTSHKQSTIMFLREYKYIIEFNSIKLFKYNLCKYLDIFLLFKPQYRIIDVIFPRCHCDIDNKTVSWSQSIGHRVVYSLP